MKKLLLGGFKLSVTAVCLCLTAALLLIFGTGSSRTARHDDSTQWELDRASEFSQTVENARREAEQSILSVKKVYWLKDEELIAPKPDPARFGTTDDPSTLDWLFEEAAELLAGQETLFTTQTPISPGSLVYYYLDETIFSVTWKQGIGGSMYTISEVKVAHPSQFRRYLAGGTYGSRETYTTTSMARRVNAVTASNGDFYAFRNLGITVFEGQVHRVQSYYVDTCYIDESGDMLFSYRGELSSQEEAQKFVDDNNIRFSLAFGPVLVDNGQRVYTDSYLIGEINETYARAVLAQKDDLHYLLMAVNREWPYYSTQTLGTLAYHVEQMNVRNAYTLDGGQTAVITVGDKLINKVVKGEQRPVSDIIYFATALPEQ